jgi:hypothetical protein
MAKKMSMVRDVIRHEKPKHVTSIGNHSKRSVPKNKNKKRQWKQYRGQGR